MPSRLVHRYAVFVHLPGEGTVRRAISRHPSFFVAVESCLGASESTGHFGYAIEDERRHRAFVLDRGLLLQLVYLRAHDQAAFFSLLNRLDRSGDQADLEAYLAEHAAL